MSLIQSMLSNAVNSLPMADVKESGSSKNPEDLDMSVAKDTTNIREPRSHEDWISMDIGYGVESRYEVNDMYNTVKKLELEDWIKNTDWNKLNYSEESNKISDGLKNNNHSGFSYSSCLMKTKEVFQNGWYPKYSVYVN